MTTTESYAAIVEFLESRLAYTAFIGGCLVVSAVALATGPKWLAGFAAIGVFLFALDAISLTLWDRLDAFYDRREAEGSGADRTDRELTPHRMSRSTKIVVVGTVMGGLSLLVGITAVDLAG